MDRTATDTRERVEVVASVEPAAAEGHSAEGQKLAASVDPTANIILRLWRAELEVGAVEKSQTAEVKGEDRKTLYTYKFTGYDKVIAAVRPALAKHGVKFWPTTTKHERVGNLTVLTVSVDFINVDDPTDRVTVEMINYGADKGDKGASKALTNCVREALKKALGITSEEDDRADETTDFEAHDAAGGREIAQAKAQRGAAVQQWAKTFKAALETATSVEAVDRLKRDNREQMESDDLPDVTRDFFNTLIADRKAKLADAFPGDR